MSTTDINPLPTRRELRAAAAAAAAATTENELAPEPANEAQAREVDATPIDRTLDLERPSAGSLEEPASAGPAQANEGPSAASRFGRALGSGLLTVLAIVGLLSVCIAIGTRLDVIKPLVVTSGSMEPSIPVGSLVLGRKMDASQIQVGDVVTVPKSSGGLVTHRVVEIAEDPESSTTRILTLRGDANNSNDGQPYYVKSVYTPALRAIPHAGIVLARMSSGPTPYVAGGTIVLLILALTYRPAPSGGSRHRSEAPASKSRRRSASGSEHGVVDGPAESGGGKVEVTHE